MEEKKDNKKKIIILGIITFIVIILSATFAFYTWSSNANQDIDVALNLSGLDAYIHYNKGTDVLTGTLLPSADYNGGISTEIELWKDPSAESKTLYGHIYMDITTIGTNLANEPALKWAITSNGEVLNTGDFVGKSNGNSISLKLNIPLQTTKQLFKIYIWLDEAMEINDAIVGETISTIVRAEATEIQMEEPTGANYIESLLVDNPETMNNDDPDGNVRYMGANPNNYVSFNNELWRIIGVFDVASTYNGSTEKRLKIIRDAPIGKYSWDNKPSGVGSSTSEYGSNDWTDSALMEVLNNGAYWNRTSGNCPNGQNGATTNCDFSEVGLINETKELIDDAVWYIGGNSLLNENDGLSNYFYGYERSSEVYGDHINYWIGKIGLMYPSDYGYATSGGMVNDRASCIAKELYKWYDPSYDDCKNNNYLYDFNFIQWTLTHNASNSRCIFSVESSGMIDPIGHVGADLGAVKPVVYLKSSIKITGGEGTSENPYTLG